MDMWKPFRNSLAKHAPNARVVFDTFHIMRHLGDALDEVRRSEYRRRAGKDRAFIKGQRYTLLSRRKNLSPTAERADSECKKGPTVIREDPFDIPMRPLRRHATPSRDASDLGERRGGGLTHVGCRFVCTSGHFRERRRAQSAVST